jgi:hypothetical protein
MSSKLVKCITPGCPNMSYHIRCLSCSAQEADRRAMQAAEGICVHSHSITGDYDMVVRLLPGYKGGPPQDGFMLDVCKECLKELPERPYNPGRFLRQH